MHEWMSEYGWMNKNERIMKGSFCNFFYNFTGFHQCSFLWELLLRLRSRYSSMIFFYEGLFYEASITMRRHQGKRTYTGWTTLDSRKVHRELLVTRTLCTRVAPRVSGALQQLCTVRQSCATPQPAQQTVILPLIQTPPKFGIQFALERIQAVRLNYVCRKRIPREDASWAQQSSSQLRAWPRHRKL